MSFCCGCLASHCTSAVVGPDHIAILHTWQECEVVVMGLCANINNFTIPAELIPCDDAIGMFWWPPANLHRLWTSDL